MARELDAPRAAASVEKTASAPSLIARALGHAFTIAPSVLHQARPRSAPPSLAWSTSVQDPRRGEVVLRGMLRERPTSDACLIVVHGLGGSADAHYCVAAAQAADAAGMSCLRIHLRGADLSGADFYHAGLASDLNEAAQSTALARYARLYVLGYSLGGHLTLRFALSESERDPRVRAVAAVCAPLDLERSARAIDHPRAVLYRHHILRGLKRSYAAVARRYDVPTPPSEVARAATLRRWDELTVVPRYGFASVEQYYASMSVGPRLSQLSIPSLLVQADADPMVPPWTYEEHLRAPLPQLGVHRLRAGGHVGFPRAVAFSPGGLKVPLESQLIAWLNEH